MTTILDIMQQIQFNNKEVEDAIKLLYYAKGLSAWLDKSLSTDIVIDCNTTTDRMRSDAYRASKQFTNKPEVSNAILYLATQYTIGIPYNRTPFVKNLQLRVTLEQILDLVMHNHNFKGINIDLTESTDHILRGVPSTKDNIIYCLSNNKVILRGLIKLFGDMLNNDSISEDNFQIENLNDNSMLRRFNALSDEYNDFVYYLALSGYFSMHVSDINISLMCSNIIQILYDCVKQALPMPGNLFRH